MKFAQRIINVNDICVIHRIENRVFLDLLDTSSIHPNSLKEEYTTVAEAINRFDSLESDLAAYGLISTVERKIVNPAVVVFILRNDKNMTLTLRDKSQVTIVYNKDDLQNLEDGMQTTGTGGGGEGGVSDHALLTGRSKANQHPISAINGLNDKLIALDNDIVSNQKEIDEVNDKIDTLEEELNDKIDEIAKKDATLEIAEHNLNPQSHNDIRNSVKAVEDSLDNKADLVETDNSKIGNIAVVDKNGQYKVSDTNLEKDINNSIDAINQEIGTLTTDVKDLKDNTAKVNEENTFTENNNFKDITVENIRDKVNGKVVLTTKTIDSNTQATYVGGDKIEMYAPDGASIQTAGEVSIIRGNETYGWETHTNIDSGNLEEHLPLASMIQPGAIKPDGVTTTVADDGTLSVVQSTTESYTKEEVDEKLADKATIDEVESVKAQYEVIPEASEEYEGLIIQYTGEDLDNYKNGYFYKCVKDLDDTYAWININVQPASGGSSDDEYGIKGDYATRYGIIKCQTGLIKNGFGTKTLKIAGGMELFMPGNTTKTMLASDITYEYTSEKNFTLFVTSTGDCLESSDVAYSKKEPDNGQDNYVAWWNPDHKLWQFKSNDTGNVWRDAKATPIADIYLNENGNITRIDYIGYRVFNDQIFALKEDVVGTKIPLSETDATTIETKITEIEAICNATVAYKPIEPNTDLNDLAITGLYIAQTNEVVSTITNKPQDVDVTFSLQVIFFSSIKIKQVLTTTEGKVYERFYQGGNWEAWNLQEADNGSVDIEYTDYVAQTEAGTIQADKTYFIHNFPGSDTPVDSSQVIVCTPTQYDEWKANNELQLDKYYLVSGEPGLENIIDDSNISDVTTFSSNKIEEEISNVGSNLSANFSRNVLKTNSVRMVAHRGYSMVAPENSDIAFRMAGDAGFYGAECDVQRASDGTFVIMHDSTLNRVSNGTGAVSEHTLEELRTYIIGGGTDTAVQNKHINCLLDRGGLVFSEAANKWVVNASDPRTNERQWVQGVPTLEEYLSICKRFNIVPVIELKEELSVNDIPAFNEILQKWSFDGKQCVVISFQLPLLEKLRELNKTIMIQPLVNLTQENIDYCAQKFGPNCGIDSPYSQATQELIDYAHKNGVEVNLWTCDDQIKCLELARMGVDYITTNGITNPYENTTSMPKIKTFRQDIENTLVDLTSAVNRNKRRIIKPDVAFEAHQIASTQPGQKTAIRNAYITHTYYNNMIYKYYTEERINDPALDVTNKKRAMDKNIYYTSAKKLRITSTLFNKYFVTLGCFEEDGNAIYDLGWLNGVGATYNSLVCALPKGCVYFYLYFRKQDDTDLTQEDKVAIDNGFEVTEIGEDNDIMRATSDNVAFCNYTTLTVSTTESDEAAKTFSKTHTYDSSSNQALSVGPFWTAGVGSKITVNFPATFTSAQILEYDRFLILRAKQTITNGSTYTCVCDGGMIAFQFATGNAKITPAEILELQNNFIATMEK